MNSANLKMQPTQLYVNSRIKSFCTKPMRVSVKNAQLTLEVLQYLREIEVRRLFVDLGYPVDVQDVFAAL